MLINPAIDPHVGLRAYLGPQKNLHTGEPYELTEAHLREWEKLYVPRVTPGRYLLIVETGDEVLDYRRAVARYAGAEQRRDPGGDHSLQSFPAAPAAHPRVLPVQLLYEEDGDLKVGAVLAQAPASFQVESPHGRRSKVKAANVLLAFERPAGGGAARRRAGSSPASLDAAFLWECSGAREFGFQDLAREYVGREPTPVEAAGVLVKLHAAPMYFYRRGKGRFQAAPRGDAQARARRPGEEEARAGAASRPGPARLARFDCPPEIAALQDELLYAPDRNKPETKALRAGLHGDRPRAGAAVRALRRAARRHDYHLQALPARVLPARRRRFAPHEVPALPADLPLAPVGGVQPGRHRHHRDRRRVFGASACRPGELRVGIHIAAPALGFAPGSPLDAIARERLSTAYMPGRKFTMLPAGRDRALLARPRRRASRRYRCTSTSPRRTARCAAAIRRLERVPIVANLRHAQYDVLNEAFESGGSAGLPFEEELRTLWRVARGARGARGRPSAGAARSTTASTSRTTGCASCRASAARRSTSWSPR